MPPYEKKCLQRIFNTIGISDTKLIDTIKVWLSDAIADTHFNDYDYTIIVGHELSNYGVFRIFDDPRIPLSYMINKLRLRIEVYADPLMDYSIKIEWREPVYREDGFRINKFYIDDVFRGITYLPTIKKVIYNNPATIIFWADDTKTVVQCQEGDDYDPEKGLAIAIAKKALGNTSRKLNDVLHKWEKKEEPSVPHSCNNCKYSDQKLSKEPCKSCDTSFGNWEAEE